jgi:hypothetical protein
VPMDVARSVCSPSPAVGTDAASGCAAAHWCCLVAAVCSVHRLTVCVRCHHWLDCPFAVPVAVVAVVVVVLQGGDHVKVMSGPYVGETGTVQVTKPLDPTKDDSDWVAFIVLDSGMKEIMCFPNDLQVLCTPSPPPPPRTQHHHHFLPVAITSLWSPSAPPLPPPPPPF